MLLSGVKWSKKSGTKEQKKRQLADPSIVPVKKFI